MAPSSQNNPLQITDLSYLGAENIKFRNTKFLTSDDDYYGIFEHESKIEVQRRIWRVRNGDLRKMMRRFPLDEPVRDQCALWVRGVAGRQFFPDANHRTAISLLRDVLYQNGIPQPSWSSTHSALAREQSKKIILNKIHKNESIRLDTLYERDNLFQLWCQFFERELALPP